MEHEEKMLNLGWLSTGRGEGSRAFLQLIQSEIEASSLDARIEFVFSNREPGEAEGSDLFFKLVESYGIPLVTLSSERFRRERDGGTIRKHRVPFHDEVMRLISGFRPAICVAAGYMLITSPEMCRRFPIINVHPALPTGPAGTWQKVIWELIERKAAESGVMVHVATEVLDSGPVLTYCSYPIRGEAFDDLWREVDGRPLEEMKKEGEEQTLFRQIRLEGVRRERPLLLETVRALAQGRFEVSGGKVLEAGGAPMSAVCLNNEVEAFLEASAS